MIYAPVETTSVISNVKKMFKCQIYGHDEVYYSQ